MIKVKKHSHPLIKNGLFQFIRTEEFNMHKWVTFILSLTGIKILAYYDPVQVFPLDIENGTVVIFTPLPSKYISNF